jgi:hypothetical protein
MSYIDRILSGELTKIAKETPNVVTELEELTTALLIIDALEAKYLEMVPEAVRNSIRTYAQTDRDLIAWYMIADTAFKFMNDNYAPLTILRAIKFGIMKESRLPFSNLAMPSHSAFFATVKTTLPEYFKGVHDEPISPGTEGLVEQAKKHRAEMVAKIDAIKEDILKNGR